jgi:hypothetical protein
MTASPQPAVEVTVLIEPSQSDRFDEIVKELVELGLSNVASHRRFMIVNGTIGAEQLSAVRDAPGVLSVREARTYRPSS